MHWSRPLHKHHCKVRHLCPPHPPLYILVTIMNCREEEGCETDDSLFKKPFSDSNICTFSLPYQFVQIPSLWNAFFFLLPHCFAHQFVLPLAAGLCVSVFVTVSHAQPRVCTWNVFRSIPQCRCRCSFPFHSSARLEAQRRGRESGRSSIKGLVCPLWCDAAVHFGYKDAAFLSQRSKK